jgi:hypothetical protein
MHSRPCPERGPDKIGTESKGWPPAGRECNSLPHVKNLQSPTSFDCEGDCELRKDKKGGG